MRASQLSRLSMDVSKQDEADSEFHPETHTLCDTYENDSSAPSSVLGIQQHIPERGMLL